MLRHLQCSATSRLFPRSGILNVLENSIYKHSVRWKGRKPRCLPLAKSKMFRIPPRSKVPKDETMEIQRLTTNFNTYFKSIRAFLHEEQKSTVGQELLQDADNVADDFLRSKEINDKWNAEVAKIREQRLLREKEKRLNFVAQRIAEIEELERQKIAKIDELVRKEKEREKHYITPDNIDEAIENALRSEVDYNFAIDVKGTTHREDPHTAESFKEKEVETRA